jgi:hypothetical protein
VLVDRVRTHIKPVMKQKAANGGVHCAGSTSEFKYSQKVGRGGLTIASSSSCSFSLSVECSVVDSPPSTVTVVVADMLAKMEMEVV